jgi:ATP diphosphatase
MAALKDELGDLLLQVVYHARMAEEAGDFRFDDVVAGICDKMVRRHPHVFGHERVETPEAQTVAWENHKAAERAAKAGNPNAGNQSPPSALDGLPAGLPELKQAEKLQRRAARVGFDWTEAKDVVGKIREELDEVVREFESGDGGRLQDELGDLLFACVNLARKANIDPGMALRGTNLKFDRRFRRVETLLAAQGRAPAEATLEEMETLWLQAKHEEPRGP